VEISRLPFADQSDAKSATTVVIFNDPEDHSKVPSLERFNIEQSRLISSSFSFRIPSIVAEGFNQCLPLV
jgi:hypothetical protein